MASQTYKAFALLGQNVEFSLDMLEARLRERFQGSPKWSLDREDDDELRVRAPGGSIQLWLNPDAAKENTALAIDFQSHPLAAEMSRCKRRVHIWTSDKDPDLVLRGVFHHICAAANEFKGVIVIDVLNQRVFEKGEPADPMENLAETAAKVKGLSAQDLYEQARRRWAEAIDLGLYDDTKVILGTTGLLQQAIKLDPRHVRALALLCDLLAAHTAYAEAASLVQRLIELEPTREEHQRRQNLLALPNGREKHGEIIGYLAVKWQTTSDW
jgi:hypothetical protein